MTPRVTVVMPVYNGERFIAEAVASVLASTFADFELLVLDDPANGVDDGGFKGGLARGESDGAAILTNFDFVRSPGADGDEVVRRHRGERCPAAAATNSRQVEVEVVQLVLNVAVS